MIMKQCFIYYCKQYVNKEEANINFDLNYIKEHFKEHFKEDVKQSKWYVISTTWLVSATDDIDEYNFFVKEIEGDNHYGVYIIDHDDIININNIDDIYEYICDIDEIGEVLCRKCKIRITLESFYEYIINKQIGNKRRLND